MVFRTVGAIATARIGVSGQALAPHQAYPCQPLPPAVNADELPSLNAPAWRHSARPARFGQTGCNTGGGHTVAAEKQPRSSRFATNRNQADAKRRPG
jgi:hypothetical protein